jgi:hypothetical protein
MPEKKESTVTCRRKAVDDDGPAPLPEAEPRRDCRCRNAGGLGQETGSNGDGMARQKASIAGRWSSTRTSASAAVTARWPAGPTTMYHPEFPGTGLSRTRRQIPIFRFPVCTAKMRRVCTSARSRRPTIGRRDRDDGLRPLHRLPLLRDGLPDGLAQLQLGSIHRQESSRAAVGPAGSGAPPAWRRRKVLLLLPAHRSRVWPWA